MPAAIQSPSKLFRRCICSKCYRGRDSERNCREWPVNRQTDCDGQHLYCRPTPDGDLFVL